MAHKQNDEIKQTHTKSFTTENREKNMNEQIINDNKRKTIFDFDERKRHDENITDEIVDRTTSDGGATNTESLIHIFVANCVRFWVFSYKHTAHS